MAKEWKRIAFVENVAAQSIIGNPTGSAAVASAITVAEQTLVGRITGGNVDDLSAAQVRTLLNVADGANAYVHPNHSGDVTSNADGAQTIGANKVTLAMHATQAAETLLANATAGAAVPTALVLAEQTVLGRITGGHLVGLTATQIRTLINVADGAKAASDAAYGAGWDGVVDVSPSQNAVYDKMQTLLSLAGGTLTGRVNQSALGFGVGGTNDITARIDSGFYQTDSATTAEGWPVNDNNWWLLLAVTHNNDANYYSMQYACSFFNQDLYFRVTGGGGTTAWAKILKTDNISDAAYGAGWNGVTDVAPSKNAVYDQMELKAPKASPVFTGSMTAGKTTIVDDSIEINANGTGDRYAYIDFHSDDTNPDYGFRIGRAPGVNGSVQLIQRGTGGLYITAQEAAPIIFQTTNLARMTIASAGTVSLASQPLFSAKVASGGANCAGDGYLNVYNLLFDSAIACNWTEITDRASSFYGGAFYAPVAGTYLFCGVLAVAGIAADHAWFLGHLVTHNRTYPIWNTSQTGSVFGAMQVSFVLECDLDANDTAYLQVAVHGTTKVIDISTDTFFMGYLLP